MELTGSGPKITGLKFLKCAFFYATLAGFPVRKQQ